MSNKTINKILWIYMALMFFVSAYIYGMVLKANGDNVEHLHTSWLIWMGNVPYKDFFQHHNPLTWYLSAPLVAYLIDDADIFSIFNIISFSMLYLIAYYHSKIFLLDKHNNRTAALFLAAVLISSYSLLWSTDYRPDTFMFVFYYMGLYELFYHIKQEKPTAKTLILSFLFFIISFFFTQKVLMHMFGPALVILYGLYSKKIKCSHLIMASILPLIILAVFVGYLYQQGTLDTYWRSNYLFNTYIPKIFEKQRIIFPPHEYIDFYIFLPVATIASIYFLYKGSLIERIFSLMYILETVIKMFYFSAFLHYVIFWLMLGIMLTVMFLSNFDKERQNTALVGTIIVFAVTRYLASVYGYEWTTINYVWFALIFAIFVIIRSSDKFISNTKILVFVGLVYLFYASWYSYALTYRKEIKSHEHLNGHELAFKVLTPCDYALNGYYATYNLKAKDPGYYSILLGQIDVLGEKSGIAKRDNLNDLIYEKKPKIISGGIYMDTYWEQRGKKIPAHKIDSYLINTYYNYSGLGDIYILKPEYQRHGCVYNGKEWKFTD